MDYVLNHIINSPKLPNYINELQQFCCRKKQSDRTEKRDQGVKFIDCALNGVREYWLVDYKK